MNLKPFLNFVVERENIRIRRESGQQWPWTDDEILRSYRFCNVRREYDTVSKFIYENVTMKLGHEEHLWFALLISRFLNLPESIAAVSPILPFSPERMRGILLKRKASGLKNFNAAYVITTNGATGDKVDLLIDRVFKPAWKRRGEFGGVETLAMFHEWLTSFNGIKSFLAGQIVADFKMLSKTMTLCEIPIPDWYSFVAIGPGSKRGLNRILGRDIKSAINDDDFVDSINEISISLNKSFENLNWKRLCNQNIQNCLCEFDKYERARLGQGRPKQLFRPHVDSQTQASFI